MMSDPHSFPDEHGRNGTLASLRRHFADLRYGTHGNAESREGKENLFIKTVTLIDPYARKALEEINRDLLLDTGSVNASGVITTADGGVAAVWTLSWPEQRSVNINPVMINAYYGRGFHHPHLRAGTVGDWPLNVFDERQAAAEVPTLRAIAAADVHNLVFQRDFRIIPVTRLGTDEPTENHTVRQHRW